MASDILWKNAKTKLAAVIFLHFEIVTFCQVSAQVETITGHIYTSSRILDIVSESCFVGINYQYLEESDLRATGMAPHGLLSTLSNAFRFENGVVVGTFDHENFVFPSGNKLKLLDSNEVVVFQKIQKDRTCLFPSNRHTKTPTVKVYEGSMTTGMVIEFINNVCYTYRNPNGYLSMDGLHRQEILNTLFRLNSSHRNVRTLSMHLTRPRQDACNQETYNSSVHISKMLPNKYMNLEIPYKTKDLNLKTCETIYEPNRDDFFHDFLKISKPVIIKNAIEDWPAYTKWTNAYFNEKYGNKKVHIKLTPSGEFEGVDFASQFDNYRHFKIPNSVRKQLLFPDQVVVRPATANMNFSAFLDTIEAISNGSKTGYSAYLEYSSIPDIGSELEEDIAEMSFFENMLALKHLNVWLSDGDTLGKLHFDPFDNFLCQVILPYKYIFTTFKARAIDIRVIFHINDTLNDS